MSEKKLSIGYDQYEGGINIGAQIAELAEGPEASELTSLIIGDWGGSYENDASETVEALTAHKERFPKLRQLFIGDMESEECEVSWIMQSNIAPLLTAFPELESLTIKGSSGLELEPASHAKLKELVIICGGLPANVLASLAKASFPQLEKLELYLGVEEYGFDGGLDDVIALANPALFPKLTYLGLKNSEIQDDIAEALADAAILDQLHTLDLSEGTLTDRGAEALLRSEKIKKLSFLDLHYHYLNEAMVARLEQSGLNVDTSDPQDADEDDDYRYPSLTE